MKNLNPERNKYNLKDFPECNYIALSGEWFKECFKDCEATEQAKKASIAICKAFNIKGICDPAYIANVISSKETGEYNKLERTPNNAEYTTKRLLSCYGSTIEEFKTGTLEQAEKFVYSEVERCF